MTKTYLGVKMVTAWEQEKDGKPGYAVKYSDGYISWSPKDVFEAAYFCLEDGHNNKIVQNDVDAFIGKITDSQLDEKTTIVTAETLTGFRQYEVSSCVDPANYDHALGVSIATERIKDRIWPMLGFVLQWAVKGLKAA
ncbi:Gp49 family protein [Solidesulfovibrio sp.]|uniref:Gp49 family protein n=1 Tax=Solidesulfovibrio sp. TaxID=2910990 RepID=UPI0026319510|nr:Gp49 family protein [Solidesulfovibrio sp.]